MASIHALRDEVVRNRTDLINNLNKLYAEDSEAGKAAYDLVLAALISYFKGNDEPQEPVQEQSKELN